MFIDDDNDIETDSNISTSTSSSFLAIPSTPSTPPNSPSPDAQAIYSIITSHRTVYNISCCRCENSSLDVKKLHAFHCCICSHKRCDECKLEKLGGVMTGSMGMEVKFRGKGWGGAFWEKCLERPGREEAVEEL